MLRAGCKARASNFKDAQADKERIESSHNEGYSLFEVLVVLAIVVVAFTSVYSAKRSNSNDLELKQAAAKISSRIKHLRAIALRKQKQTIAEIDVANRKLTFGPTLKPVQLQKPLKIQVTSAQSEIKSKTVTAIRFFPNGSSSGGTINIEIADITASKDLVPRKGYEIRVNWLTGRVSSEPYTKNK